MIFITFPVFPLHLLNLRGVTPQCSFSVTSIDTAVVDGIILRGSLLLPEGNDSVGPGDLKGPAIAYLGMRIQPNLAQTIRNCI